MASDMGAEMGSKKMGASDLGASDSGASDRGASDSGASDRGASDRGRRAEEARPKCLGPAVDGRGTMAGRGNVADRDYDRAGGGGARDLGAGAPGGTLGTGGSGREQDR